MGAMAKITFNMHGQMKMCGGGGSDKEARKAREARELREKRITKSRATIDTRFEEFNDGYFDTLRNKAREFYQPQFEEQFDTARRKLRFGLARSGNSTSSAGAESLGDLARDRALGLSKIEDNATNAVEAQKANLENQRHQMYAQATAAHNPAAAASQAITRADYLSRPPEFNAIGDMFTNVMNQAATYQEAGNNGKQGFGAFGGVQSRQDSRGNPYNVSYKGS